MNTWPPGFCAKHDDISGERYGPRKLDFRIAQIGYRRSLSIAFVVREEEILILGFFYDGRLATAEILDERL
jgi:hypothetical protein